MIIRPVGTELYHADGRTDFLKQLNIKFNDNPSSGSRVVPRGRTDRLEEANSCFSQFCERA
jgi:hypothetical protein